MKIRTILSISLLITIYQLSTAQLILNVDPDNDTYSISGSSVSSNTTSTSFIVGNFVRMDSLNFTMSAFDVLPDAPGSTSTASIFFDISNGGIKIIVSQPLTSFNTIVGDSTVYGTGGFRSNQQALWENLWDSTWTNSDGFSLTAIPEPATYATWLGIFGLGFMILKRKMRS